MDPMRPEENTLLRYEVWALETYRDFVRERDQNGIGPNTWKYMSIWFGLLYVTVEGWRELGLHDAAVDALLAEAENVELLRRYRNGVFHFQREYWDARLDDMVSKPTTGKWAEDLTAAFDRYFQRRIVETNHPGLRKSP